MKTIQAIIEDETYAKLKDISALDKKTLSTWVKEAVEKELSKRRMTKRTRKW